MNYDELFNANVHAYDPLSFSMWKSPVSWREHRRAQRWLWPSPCGYPLCHSSRPYPPYLPVTWITYTKLSRDVAKVAIWDTPLDFICFICIELYWFVLILWNILQCPLASSIVSSHWVETLHESGNESLSMSQDHSKHLTGLQSEDVCLSVSGECTATNRRLLRRSQKYQSSKPFKTI